MIQTFTGNSIHLSVYIGKKSLSLSHMNIWYHGFSPIIMSVQSTWFGPDILYHDFIMRNVVCSDSFYFSV